MLKKPVVSIIFIVTFLVLGLLVINLSNGRKNLSKDAIKLEYGDITRENPSLGNLATGAAADIDLVEESTDKDFYTICFKKWKPYKDISVYLDGNKLKIFYEEDESKEKGNIWINGVVNKNIAVKDIIIYKNNKRVLNGIERSFGIE